jgi:GNAT superfamily N-acetyltransferase
MTDELIRRRWTFGFAYRRLIEILREEGLKALWFKILGETVYRRVILFERLLCEPISDVTTHGPVSIHRLSATEIAEYVEFRAGTPLMEVHRRLDAGHACFIARDFGRLVSCSWAATSGAWMHYLSREVPVAAGEFYIYDSYTDPDYRRRGVSQAVNLEMLRYFRRSGYERALRAVSPENVAGLRAASQNGFQPCELIGYVKIGPWRRDICRLRDNTQRYDASL